MTERHTAIALGIVRDNDSVLLIERQKKETGVDGRTLQWAFPGGKIEPDENPLQAAVREVQEETGALTNSLEIIHEQKHPNFPVYVFYVACKLITTEHTLGTSENAIANIRWVPTGELSEYLGDAINDRVKLHLNI